MAIKTEVTKPLEAGYVQVEATNKKSGYKTYYKVPQKSAGKFAKDLQIQDKNFRLYDNIIYITSAISAFGASVYFTRKIESWMKKFLIQVGSTMGASMLASLGFAKYAQGEREQFLKDYKAKEIHYRT